jgi:hypothetical protein
VVRRRTVQQAYREIVNVPLPARPKSAAWTTAWAAVGAGVCLGVIALGGRELAWSPPQPPSAVADAAPKAPVVEAVLAPVIAVPEPPPHEEPLAPLAKLDADATARAAIAAVLGAWHEHPLDADEPARPADFGRVAHARGLEYLPFSGNATMLRLLDHPAVLEVQLPDTDGPRFAALLGMTDAGAVLAVADARVTVPTAALDRVWLGQAHLLWRDFEGIGAVGTLGPDSRGPTVAHLQTLLQRAGAYAGPETGVFDAVTGQAVLGFQRSRLLDADGLVGRLTRVVLYAAAGGYPRPTLAGGGAS